MAENKTKPTGASVEDYIASRANAQQRTDCRELWHVDAAPRSEAGRPEAGFVGEVLNLIKSESASGWVGWNGREYVWVQGSD